MQRIARVLFSGSTTNRSMEPLELSLDDVVTDQQPLDAMDTKDTVCNTVQRAKTADDSCIVEKFLLEYSCHDDSTCQDQDRSEILEETLVASPTVSNPCVSDADLENISKMQNSEPSLSSNPLQFSHTFHSPSSRTPLKALAQSTPKPGISSFPVFNAVQNDQSMPNDPDTNHTRDTLLDSPNPFSQKTLAQAVFDVSCHEAEVNCNLDDSEVTFGSPSRSFEVAMAREADKFFCGVERDSRTSGLGMFNIYSLLRYRARQTVKRRT